MNLQMKVKRTRTMVDRVNMPRRRLTTGLYSKRPIYMFLIGMTIDREPKPIRRERGLGSKSVGTFQIKAITSRK